MNSMYKTPASYFTKPAPGLGVHSMKVRVQFRLIDVRNSCFSKRAVASRNSLPDNTVQGSVVQSVVSLTSSLRVISLTVLADSIYNILIFLKFQHICVSLDVNFNESLTNDVVSFEQLGPGRYLRCF